MTTPLPLLPARIPERVGSVDVNTVYQCDALSLLARLPDNSVDMILCDPPYGIGYESSWTTRNDGSLRTTPTKFGEDKLDTTWLSQIERVLKDKGALYLFTRWDVLHHWNKAINDTGLKTVQRIIWYKAHWKMGDLRYYGSQTEDILFARKGEHHLLWSKREGNVWYSADALYQNDGYWEHPTQKPLKIIRKAIQYSCPIDGIVLDPFIGSGTTAVAARNLGRRYIGCDISPEYVAIARRRLALPYTPLMFTDDQLAG